MKKNVFSFTAIVIAIVMFFGCKTGDNPKNVANTWLTAFYHMDYETAKKVSTDETKKMLTQLAQFSSMVPDSTKQQYKKITVNIKAVKETGNNADVTYFIIDPSSSEESNKEQMLHLAKQNGKWLVQFSKNDPFGGAEEKPDSAQGPVAVPDQHQGDAPPTEKN